MKLSTEQWSVSSLSYKIKLMIHVLTSIKSHSAATMSFLVMVQTKWCNPVEVNFVELSSSRREDCCPMLNRGRFPLGSPGYVCQMASAEPNLPNRWYAMRKASRVDTREWTFQQNDSFICQYLNAVEFPFIQRFLPSKWHWSNLGTLYKHLNIRWLLSKAYNVLI